MDGCEFCTGPLRRPVDILCETCLTEMSRDRAFAAIVIEALSHSARRSKVDDDAFDGPVGGVQNVNYEVSFEIGHS